MITLMSDHVYKLNFSIFNEVNQDILSGALGYECL